VSNDDKSLWQRMVEIFKSAPTPMKRWSSDRLLQVLVYLETKDPATLTREDHYMTAEYLMMRYLPKDDAMTEAQWQRKSAKLRAKIDFIIDHPDRPAEPIKDDPEFAEWLRNRFRKKIDRDEILKMLACFETDDWGSRQENAIRGFTFYLSNPDNFQIDDDLRARMAGIVDIYKP
jgi:hypothetical protein